MARSISWPTALVLCVAIAAIVATVLGGRALGLDAETLQLVLSGEGLLAGAVLAVMRALLAAPAQDETVVPAWHEPSDGGDDA